MLPYLIMFALSTFLIWKGESVTKDKKRKILITIGLLLPCVMAGIRDISVGTDTEGYIHNLYLLSPNSKNLSAFFKTAYGWYLQKDYLYLIITYLVGKNNLSFTLLLFIYELLIVVPIYFSFKKLKFDNNQIAIGFMSVYLLMYNVTFNMLRQSIAISFIVLAFSYYITSKDKANKIKSYILALVAAGFHSTSIVAIPLFWVYNAYSSKRIKEKQKDIFSLSIIFLSCLIIVFYKPLLHFIGESGIYPVALHYLNQTIDRDFSFYQAFINLLIIVIIVIGKKSIKEKGYSYKFLLTMSIINILLSSGLGYLVLYSKRIMLYIQFIIIYCFFPKLYEGEKNSKKLLVIMLILIISWILYFGVMNVNETVPYITTLWK